MNSWKFSERIAAVDVNWSLLWTRLWTRLCLDSFYGASNYTLSKWQMLAWPATRKQLMVIWSGNLCLQLDDVCHITALSGTHAQFQLQHPWSCESSILPKPLTILEHPHTFHSCDSDQLNLSIELLHYSITWWTDTQLWLHMVLEHWCHSGVDGRLQAQLIWDSQAQFLHVCCVAAKCATTDPCQYCSHEYLSLAPFINHHMTTSGYSKYKTFCYAFDLDTNCCQSLFHVKLGLFNCYWRLYSELGFIIYYLYESSYSHLQCEENVILYMSIFWIYSCSGAIRLVWHRVAYKLWI